MSHELNRTEYTNPDTQTRRRGSRLTREERDATRIHFGRILTEEERASDDWRTFLGPRTSGPDDFDPEPMDEKDPSGRSI